MNHPLLMSIPSVQNSTFNPPNERLTMHIILGKTEVSMLKPPNAGTVQDGTEVWTIGRTGSGNIILRRFGVVHPDFMPDGMDLLSFVYWINSKL